MYKKLDQSQYIYRPEIDGLRALAVIPVMLYHADVPLFSGGYTGVDIFFVISGYLITQSLLAEERYSPLERLQRFYVRRIRRILPALMLVVFVTLGLGFLYFLPNQLIDLGKSVIATSLFVSNFWFWSQAGYFAAPSEMMPLLHTWSLAVEEQFYIAFPILLIVLSLKKKITSNTILLLLVICFTVSTYATFTSPGVAFYWPTRSWELLAGSWLAIIGYQAPEKWRQPFSIIGATLILFSIFYFDTLTPFPGFAALVPVGGTLLIISGGGTSTVGTILSQRFFVWVGLISYSLYLWHWPIIVFAKQIFLNRELSTSITLYCIGLTFILSYLSWRYVEQPFRTRTRDTRKALFLGAGVVLGSGLIIGVAVVQFDGLPHRFEPSALALAETHSARQPNGCRSISRNLCKLGEGDPNYILWGDSHAGALSPAIALVFKDQAGLFASFNGCPPLGLVPENLRGSDRQNCERHTETLVDMVRSSDSIRTVILSAFWTNYEYPVQALRDILDNIKGKKAIILLNNPTPGFNVPWALALGGGQTTIRPTVKPETFRILNEYSNVELIELSEALCNEGECAKEFNGRAIYSDGNHISESAAISIIAPFLMNKLTKN